MNTPECQHCNSQHYWVYGGSKVCLKCDGDFEPRKTRVVGAKEREHEIRMQVEAGSWPSLTNDDLKFLFQELDRTREISKVFRQTVEWYADGIYPDDVGEVSPKECRVGKRARAALRKVEQMEKDT